MPPTIPEDSLRRRYVYKLTASLAGLGSALIAQAMVPRTLGPAAFGDYSFLLGIFTPLIGFLSLSTATPYYTMLSRRQGETSLIAYYAYACGGMALITALLTLTGQFPPVARILWPGQRAVYIWTAAVFAFVTWHVQVVGMTADALGLTTRAELARIVQKAISLAALALMFFFGLLTLSTYFAYCIASVALLYLSWLAIIRRHAAGKKIAWRDGITRAKQYSSEFYEIAAPLTFYSGVGFVALTFDRWLLQRVGGSTQQGYFGFSYQLGALLFLFASAMIPLLAREFSIAAGEGDMAKLGDLLRRHGQRLYVVAAYFAVFVAAEADLVVRLFAGERFASASTAVAIMALYPVHQTYGQLNGSLCYATGRTREYRTIGSWALVVGMALSGILLAPRNAGGLGMGAVGLAAKMVIIQVLSVSLQLQANTRAVRISARPLFVHQAVVLAVMAAAVLPGHYLVSLLNGSLRDLPRFLVSGVLYSALVAAAITAFPWLIGMNRREFRERRSMVMSRWRRVAGTATAARAKWRK